MIKPLIILFNTVSVFLFSVFFGDSPVTVTGLFPKTTKSTSEFIAEIKINKADVNGFGKFQFEVPQGFTVKEIDSQSGNFSFTENTAKIIWTALPKNSEMTLKFLINVDNASIGTKTIHSKFSYVVNNEKQFTEMPPVDILIEDGVSEVKPLISSLDSIKLLNNKAQNPTGAEIAINCFRTITTGTSPNEYNIEVKIIKGETNGFAKFQELLPIGYTVKSGKTAGSAFSVSDGKIKFVWVALPTETELTLSYTLQKTDVMSAATSLTNGEFSYLKNDKSQKFKLLEDVIDKNAPISVVKDETKLTDNSSESNNVSQKNTNESSQLISKKQGNILYSVQVGAFINAIKSEVLSKKFNISEIIKSEMAEGYSKFMVGDFAEYKKARDHRETIKEKGCKSAFVVAYNGPKRITVQEALMITSQKWFK